MRKLKNSMPPDSAGRNFRKLCGRKFLPRIQGLGEWHAELKKQHATGQCREKFPEAVRTEIPSTDT
ncbi:MAG: hypothetical protein K2P87_13165, partial [Lachnospiraceae bacterium]|nr:hypothetical protein [Lachnospiraceae bacterium]